MIIDNDTGRPLDDEIWVFQELMELGERYKRVN